MNPVVTGIRAPNPQQDAPIEHTYGPIRITAGAGTGKTFTLTQRVVRLIERELARPDQILALTFTNKAAAEMRERIGEACLALGVPPDADPVSVLTYNAFGNSVVAEWGGMIGLPPRPTLLSKSERWLLLWDCLPHVDFQSISLMHLRGTYGSPLPNILQLGGRLKDELATPDDLLNYLAGLPTGHAEAETERGRLMDYARALQVYEAMRQDRGVIDYGDQIALAVRALERAEVRAAYRERFRFVLVDEYQDTNYAQSMLVRLLTADFDQQNVCVVGDVRQAIYRFRGAAPDNLERFVEDFSSTASYSLQLNYRSTEQILEAANRVWSGLAEDQFRLESPDHRQGPPVVACTCEDADSEWEWIARRIREQHGSGVPYREMAVLVRKNDFKIRAWRGLIARGIPAVMTGGTDLYRTPEIQEITAYLRALAHPSDNIALAHIASSDSFGIDERAVFELIGPLSRGMSLFDRMIERATDPTCPADLRLFLATFQQLLSDAATRSPARVVESVIGLRRGAYTDQQRANAYRFHTVAEEFARDRVRGATVARFVAYLNLLLAAPADEDEAGEVGDEEVVHVLTVHAAKGLERDVVFVATASRSDFTLLNRKDVLPAPLRHPAAGMPRHEPDGDLKSYQRDLTKWEDAQHHLEEQRILYVALTRARQQLYLSWHRLPLLRGKEREPLPLLKQVLLCSEQERFDRVDWEDRDTSITEVPDPAMAARHFARLQARTWVTWPNEEPHSAEGEMATTLLQTWRAYVAEERLVSAGDDVVYDAVRRWTVERRRAEGLLNRCLSPMARPADAERRLVVEVPNTLSYTMLATYQECGRKAYLRFRAGFPGEPRPGATGPGQAFHAAVESASRRFRNGERVDFDYFCQTYTEAAADAQGVEAYTLQDTDRQMLHAYWNSADRLATPVAVEQEFYWRVGPGYLHGFIDRIQRCPDGALELVDWKTARRAATPAEARDTLQLAIYALAAQEVLNLRLDRLTLVYPRLNSRVSVSYSEEELALGRMRIVDLMEGARTARYDQVNTRHCQWCEYRLICPAAATSGPSHLSQQ